MDSGSPIRTYAVEPREGDPATQRAVPARAPVPTSVEWGLLAAIDLHGRELGRLADPDSIRAFVPALIAAIGMRAHGPLALERFGDRDLEGWSAMQFIETSSITIPADEVWAAASSTANETRRSSGAAGWFGGPCQPGRPPITAPAALLATDLGPHDRPLWVSVTRERCLYIWGIWCTL